MKNIPVCRMLSWFCCCVLLAGFSQSSIADSSPGRRTAAAIASAHPLASEAGMRILANGGNAFDAAVTVSAVLAVVEPYSSGIGGGGFWLLHRQSDDFQVMIDGRERAPLAATENLYLDKQGNVIPRLSMDGALAAGIPGEPAALDHIARKYGRLPLSTLLAPAIQLASEGFETNAYYARMAGFRQSVLEKYTASSVFLDGKTVPKPGYNIVQTALAETLQQLADHGRDGFYKGDVAKNLVAGVKKAGGIWTEKDLAEYRVIERQPIKFTYGEQTIVTASPPSSGGIALATMLNILSGAELDHLNQTERVHLMVESMRRAYRDRAEYLGDPDFVDIPSDLLTDEKYAAGLRASIRMDRATASSSLPGRVTVKEGFHTTHFSILDAEGNRVAATLSINYPFGSGFVVPGTGVLLNDEMDDFSARPGVPNAYGLVGGKANSIEPGKRPLSSMTPTFVEGPNGMAIIGTPGGSRIITMLLQGILKAQSDTNPESWVKVPRIHHQYLPDVIQYEADALSTELIELLESMGHQLRQVDNYGNMQAIYQDRVSGSVRAASDPRGFGLAIVQSITVGNAHNKK